MTINKSYGIYKRLNVYKNDKSRNLTQHRRSATPHTHKLSFGLKKYKTLFYSVHLDTKTAKTIIDQRKLETELPRRQL